MHLIHEESVQNTLNLCSNKNWIRGMGVCEMIKSNILILLISTQKLHFGDDDAIYDILMQKRHHNRHDISRDPIVELSDF